MWMEMIGVVIGAVISLVTTIVIENLRTPDLSLRIEDPPIDNAYDNLTPQAKTARFLRVQLWNNEMPKILRWISRETAMHCNANIQVLHKDDLSPVFVKEIPARWAGSDEPLSPQLDSSTRQVFNVFDQSKYNAAFRRNCHPGTKETIDVVARFDNDDECYIWTNDSYVKGWRNIERKIPKGRYFVIVTVFSAGEKIHGYFKLENSVSVKDFRLLEVNDKERKLLSKIY